MQTVRKTEKHSSFCLCKYDKYMLQSVQKGDKLSMFKALKSQSDEENARESKQENGRAGKTYRQKVKNQRDKEWGEEDERREPASGADAALGCCRIRKRGAQLY
jgi:hypothetical protein